MKSMIKKIASYFKEVVEEMRKVTWPNRKTTTRYTILVITVSVAVGVLFAVLDLVFNLGLEGLLQISA
ncbi:MAG: preprotein translocase subunit SecE [Patescibacteria group bacterium]